MFDFKTYHSVDGLDRLDRDFLSRLTADAPNLKRRLLGYRAGNHLTPTETSELVLALAPHLERFLSTCFSIDAEVAALCAQTLRESRVGAFRQEFVARRTRRYRGAEADDFARLDRWLDDALTQAPLPGVDRELAVACYAHQLLDDAAGNAADIDRLTAWCKLARETRAGQRAVADWGSFRLPQVTDPAHLVSLQSLHDDLLQRKQGAPGQFRQRDGFRLTDTRMNLREALTEVHYCVYCHEHDGDFCSKGFPENKKQPAPGLKVDPLGVILTGCPVEEKISEMHVLKRDGFGIAALAVAMADNPMIPATGHRICNDCMKACIYQKKDPVDIPQIETRVLTDVLALPWGVEIYDLLTRWNPLRAYQYVMKPYNGRKVLISGMGPAGFTMAHHLTMEGCAVVGIDGLKIEPLPAELLTAPIRDFTSLVENLDERIMAGFGGVAEYGITVRWDKNFLTLIYLTLARRPTFQVFGGTRLGGTLTLENAWQLGFDHVSIAHGAGLPRVISIGNSLARGMRQASDFLMALQLTGAAKADSLANLQVRLPAVVVGGGLTAVDTATEVQAYYIKHVEKTLHRYDELVSHYGEAHVCGRLDAESRQILDELLAHGHAVCAERVRAGAAGVEPDFITLVRQWGGVTIVYRRGLNESPAYQRNHEEVAKAMQEGIYYSEGLDPLRCELDEYGHVATLVCRQRTLHEGRWLESSREVAVPARAVLVAAGTFPNTIYEAEHRGSLTMEHDYFLPHVEHQQGLQPVGVAEHCKAPEFGPFTSHDHDRRRVSFIGDTHPVFNGSVVKAIASASRSYTDVVAGLGYLPAPQFDAAELAAFRHRMTDQLSARVAAINNDHPAVVELWIHAPMAARNFRAGQFFRLQTFERLSPVVNGTRLQIPLQTVSGAGVEGDRVHLLLLRWGPNAKLAARLAAGDPVILMGPTGAPAPLDTGHTILVVAGSWGAAVMLALGPALRAAGSRVLYLAAYGNDREVYYKQELETAADQIIWAVRTGNPIATARAQDASVVNGDVIDTINRYADGEIRPGDDQPGIALGAVDEVLIMGGTGLLRGMQSAFRGALKTRFRDNVKITGTVGSPMQCMLKGVCGQCLQWQIDPDTGQRTRAVFSCSQQDQPLMWIDIDNLAARQGQNRLQEQLTALWVDHVLTTDAVAASNSTR